MAEAPGAVAGLFARKVVLTWHDFEIPDTEDIYVYAEWSSLLRVLLLFLSFGVLAPLAS